MEPEYGFRERPRAQYLRALDVVAQILSDPRNAWMGMAPIAGFFPRHGVKGWQFAKRRLGVLQDLDTEIAEMRATGEAIHPWLMLERRKIAGPPARQAATREGPVEPLPREIETALLYPNWRVAREIEQAGRLRMLQDLHASLGPGGEPWLKEVAAQYGMALPWPR